jgi:hypothetical protein
MEWESAKRAMRAKIEMVGRIGRIITSEGLSADQTAALRTEVQLMMDDPNYAIVANFEINWTEVQVELRETLTDLANMTEGITQVLALGGGMPMALIAGDSQYSGTTIKLEILNVEYHSFKQRVQRLIEEQLFKPIALRKGFVGIDDWGNPNVHYPRLTFSRVSLRDESVFDILFSLYQKGSLPVSVILDILNLDPDDVKRAIENDMFTVNDPNFNQLIGGMLVGAVEDIMGRVDLADKLIKEMGLKQLNMPAPGSMDPAAAMGQGGPPQGGDPAAEAGGEEAPPGPGAGDEGGPPGGGAAAPPAPMPPMPMNSGVMDNQAIPRYVPDNNLQPQPPAGQPAQAGPFGWGAQARQATAIRAAQRDIPLEPDEE